MSTKTNNKKDEQLQIDSPAYEKSDALKQAEAQLQEHISNQPAAYSFQYQDRMNDLLTKLDSRPSFQYDADADALYQYYKDRYVQNGQRAMEDTMGQAAALTGGYGSSYAQSVGQQTYNEYMQGLNDVIPELYQLALSKYNQDTASLQDQYAMYANLDAQDYSRWQEEQDRWYDQLDRLTDNARYEAEQDYERQQEELEKGASVDPKDYASYSDFLSATALSGKYLYDPADEFGGSVVYNNGNVTNGNIMRMQRALGLKDDAMWSEEEKALTNLTANQAWEAYQQGRLQNYASPSRTTTSTAEKKKSPAVQSFISQYMTREQAAKKGITEKEWTNMIQDGLHSVNLTEDEFDQLVAHYKLPF